VGFWNKKSDEAKDRISSFNSSVDSNPSYITGAYQTEPQPSSIEDSRLDIDSIDQGPVVLAGVSVHESSKKISIPATPMLNITDSSDPEEIVAARFGGKVRSVLGSGTVVQGKLSFDTTVRIDGKLSGEISSTKSLIVGRSGLVDAVITVENLVVIGTVKGKVRARGRVEILTGGVVDGDIEAATLVVSGGVFNGQSRVVSAVEAALEKVAEKAELGISVSTASLKAATLKDAGLTASVAGKESVAKDPGHENRLRDTNSKTKNKGEETQISQHLV
jgi:cytoskeletal protein CcmA (bactofilin family)